MRGERRGVGAARAVRRPVRIPGALDRLERRAVEEQVRPALAVAAGDDDRLRPERRGPRAPAPRAPRRRRARSARAPRAGSASPPPRAGRCARRGPALPPAAAAPRPTLATITGSTTTGAPSSSSRPSATAAIVGSSNSIPILTASDADVRGDGPDLVEDELARKRLHRDDLDRVLRGQRDDRRGPVHAAARERLQVGLDPRAAARVGGRDRDRHRCRSLCHRPKASQGRLDRRRRPRAQCAGSGRRDRS